MPVRITGNMNNPRGGHFPKISRSKKSLYRERYGKLDFHPRSELHNEILSEVLVRARQAADTLSTRHGQWREIDKLLTGYIPADVAEDERKFNDDREPVSIVIPEMYSQREIFLTYMTSVFGADPFYQVTGTGPEDELGSILMELTLQSQTKKRQFLLESMKAWSAAFNYGFAPIHIAWEVEEAKRTRTIPITDVGFDGQPIQVGFRKESFLTTVYDGNAIEALDPYFYLPDPTAPIYKPNDGEFVGWMEETNWNNLHRMETDPDSMIFNVDFLKGDRAGSSIYTSVVESREAGQTKIDRENSNANTNPIDVIWFYWNLIPKDWKLGSGEEPETWLFGVANDAVLVAAEPLEFDHGKFPVVVAAPESQGHEFIPIAKMDLIKGSQEQINFWNNAHVRSVRDFVKNKWLANPNKVHMPDLVKGKSIIRLKRAAWNSDMDNALQQLPMQDMTFNFMNDLQTAQQLSRGATGVVDSLMGVQRTGGERVTKAEFNATQGAALSRLQKTARVFSEQANIPMANIMALQTQQFMTTQTYAQIAGRHEAVLREEYGILDPAMRVTPYDLNTDYDMYFSDGSVAGGESADGWMQFFQMMLQSEELMADFDVSRVGLHIARLLGNRTPHEFKRKGLPGSVQSQNNSRVQAQAQAGNIVPIEAANGF